MNLPAFPGRQARALRRGPRGREATALQSVLAEGLSQGNRAGKRRSQGWNCTPRPTGEDEISTRSISWLGERLRFSEAKIALFHQESFSSPHFPQSPNSSRVCDRADSSCTHHPSWQRGTEPGTWLELNPKPLNMCRSNHHVKSAAAGCRMGLRVVCQPAQPSRSHAHGCDLWDCDSVSLKHHVVARNGSW